MNQSPRRPSDGFPSRLRLWLVATQEQRRTLLVTFCALMLFMDFVPWRAFFIGAGLAAMLEGWAMLMSDDHLSR